jgi:hypothetical protein
VLEQSSVAALARPDRLGPALAQALDDPRWATCEVSLVAGGKSNLTFVVSSAAGEVVLRRPPAGPLLPSAHDMGREARIQQALAPTAVPVAPVLLTDDGALLGVPCYVMAKVDGHVIRETLPPGYATRAADRVALAYALVDALAEVTWRGRPGSWSGSCGGGPVSHRRPAPTTSPPWTSCTGGWRRSDRSPGPARSCTVTSGWTTA